MLETKDVVELDNNVEYVVVSKLYHTDGRLYYYLLELKGDDVLFVYEDNGELVEVTDKDLNGQLLELFMEQEVRNLEEEDRNKNKAEGN